MGLARKIHDEGAAEFASGELHALERRARALCDQAQQLAATARSRGVLVTREASLQLEVLVERRMQLMQLLATPAVDFDEPRMARLETLIMAFEFSRTYFMSV